MDDFIKRIGDLPLEKRALLEKRLLEKLSATKGPSGIPKRETEGPLPLSFAQQRLWFFSQLNPESTTYNEPSALRLKGVLDIDALERALGEILRRHEALRASFFVIEGQPFQRANDVSDYKLPVRDLSGVEEHERETSARAAAEDIARRPFDLTAGVLLRAELLRLDRDDHLLVLVIHHIASDGWSINVFYRELTLLYEAFSQGRPSPLDELPVQYGDFALWQREKLSDEALAADFAYWEKHLEGANVLELPYDRARPAAQTFEGAHYTFKLADRLGPWLDGFTRRSGATKFMVLLAAYAALLQRYTAREDMVLGTPIANRNRVELEGLIGFFANTLALRLDLSGDPTFAELVGRVREVAMGAYSHQDMPFERLVEHLHPDRHLSHLPLVQVVFTFQNVPRHQLSLPGLEVERFEIESGTSKFDLVLFTRETSEGLSGRFEYSTDLFERATIERMGRHFNRLLEGAAADPEARISDLPILTEAERRTILAEWNATDTDYPAEECVHEVFDRIAAQHRDAPAVEYGDTRLTYGRLLERSNRFANHLRRLGVGTETPVGLCMERSADLVVAMLGILKAGGAYLPIDLSCPPERLAFMLEDSGAKAVVTQGALRARMPEGLVSVVCVDTDSDEIERESPVAPENVSTAESTAYIIYTSGSTGSPKGSLVCHRGVNRLVLNTNYVDFRPSDVVAQASNVAFDASTFEIWGALLNGARLAGIDRDSLLSVGAFERAVRESRISVMFLTTALFNHFARTAPQAFSTLRYLCFGGETADPASVRVALESGRPEMLVNLYGPTENTSLTTWYPVEEVGDGAAAIPIGKPISNTKVYILDGKLRPVPVGVIGEICIGGDGLAKGYLNRPELTGEAFVSNPYSGDGGGLLYRTGDLARFLSDGNIDFIGRRDFQVKIRGFRVELGEIETVLRTHGSVGETVVLCREDRPGDKRLVAYVVARGSQEADAAALRRYLDAKLPDYMVPSAFVVMDAFPLTPNKKIDRRALPPPEEMDFDSGGAFVPARTPVEEALAKIWAEALGVSRVGVRDNFFDLGGHSLLAVRVFAQIEKVFGRKLPLAVLFETPTIEGLAERLGEDGLTDVFPPLVPIETTAEGTPFFAVATADAFVYAELAKVVGRARPFYGLHPQGLVDARRPELEIPQLAYEYVREVRKVQPKGPYLLGGTCAGGSVAYEMAQQLRAGGEQVALVAMFDSPGPFARSYRKVLRRVALRRFARHMKTHVSRLVELPWREKGRYFAGRLSRLARKLAGRPVPPERSVVYRDVEHTYYMAFNGAYVKAAAAYSPLPYDGRVVLFLAEDQAAWRFSHSRLGWKKLAREIDLHVIPRTHSDMLQPPQAGIVGELLNECIEKTQVP